MPFQPQGFSGVVPEVDATFRAGRVSMRPPEVLTWLSVSAQSGAMTGVAAASAVFSLRNTGTNLLMIRRIGIGAVLTTAFTTAQKLDYSIALARSFTVADSGGTAIALTGSNAKHRTSLATLTTNDCRIATTTALTAGTKTLDANRMGMVAFWGGAIGATLNPVTDNLFSHNTGDYPLVLANNEGVNIMNETLMGATGVVALYVNIEFAEATAF